MSSTLSDLRLKSCSSSAEKAGIPIPLAWRGAGLSIGIYASPVASDRDGATSFPSSGGSLVQSRGYTPVTRKPAVTFLIVIVRIHASLKKEYLVTALPGFFVINSWHTHHHSSLSGPKHPLSRG